ncbi:MAG: hypothetical protein IAF38_22845 [Bacteroidia bacterium]|nr:hypothetical protein [Bacteroidia bacterium]
MEKPKPIFDKRIFWDVNFEKIDYDLRANWVIERVMEKGDVEDIRQLRRYYGDEKVRIALLISGNLSWSRIHLAAAIIDEPIEKFGCYESAKLNKGNGFNRLEFIQSENFDKP